MCVCVCRYTFKVPNLYVDNFFYKHFEKMNTRKMTKKHVKNIQHAPT